MIGLLKICIRVLALPAALVLFAGSASAHSHKLKRLEIVHPWCIETETTTAAVYMTVKNSARQGDRLLRASTTIADKTELHALEAVSGGAQKNATSFGAKGGGELILRRGGSHILLTGLKKPLGAYDSFVMTLVFERAGSVEVEVQVEEASVLTPKH